MNIGVQYYRPPFPIQRHWENDFQRIKERGLDTIQLWITWAWVESKSGEFRFDDYDRLMDLAGSAGLQVILSTIAEIQPHWIHREIPDSEMIDHRGHRVVSSCRNECHFGLTPGGCTQNPAVWSRMSEFLSVTVKRYRHIPHLAGWDAWNELRWNVQADGLVCFCPHCLASFRTWLAAQFGDLDGLNHAWQRRYSAWDEVVPGKLPDRTLTEMMAWQKFITHRANRHGQARYDLIKALDPTRDVTVHSGDPSPLTSGDADYYALSRGNDWVYAEGLDGIGCSSFPRLYDMDDTTYTARVEFVRSAARAKKIWLSELQGGRGAFGLSLFRPVDGASQQRWVWRGLAGGADKIIFWCWRDEVFGRESAGFGMTGRDGHAEDRLKATARTGAILRQHHDLLSSFVPEPPQVGVLFSPWTYYFHWSLTGNADVSRQSLEGYCQALVQQSIPYTVVEEEHLDALTNLKVLFLPRLLATSQKLEQALVAFVRGGGTLVCESECGAYSPEGIYRLPEERFLAGLLSGGEIGRRDIPADGAISVKMPTGKKMTLVSRNWLTPWASFPGTAWSQHPDGVLIGESAVGAGRVIHCGSFFGEAYAEKRFTAFEHFVGECAAFAGLSPAVQLHAPKSSVPNPWYFKAGTCGADKMVYAFAPAGTSSAQLTFQKAFFGSQEITDLITGRVYNLSVGEDGSRSLTLECDSWGIAVLTDSSSAR